MTEQRRIEAHKFNRWVSIEWGQVRKGDILRIFDGADFIGLFRVIAKARNDRLGTMAVEHVRPTK